MAIEYAQEAWYKADKEGLRKIANKVDNEARKVLLDYMGQDLTDKTKKEALVKVKSVVRASQNDLKEWSRNEIAKSYIEGFNASSQQILGTTKIKPTNGKEAKELNVRLLQNVGELEPHREAVNALISDSYLDFANGMNGVVKGAERQLNEVMKRQIRAKMIKGQLKGSAIREIKKEVKEVLSDRGFSVLVDRGGKKWSLNRYSEMLARTHIIKSSNEGAINRAVEKDVDLMEISNHATTCNLCADYEGLIYSISGNNEKYPVLDIPIPIHPNCRHSLIPRPDLEE